MTDLSNKRLGATFPQFYTVASRVETFDNWPKDSHLQPIELAEAGFFFRGDGDSVICYCCGGELSHWGPGDEAWAEHEKFYPSCAHILLHKMGDLRLGHGHGVESCTIQNCDKCFRKDCVHEDRLKTPGIEDYKKLEEENKYLRHQFLCKTCLQEKACIVFLPCGHLSACPVCSNKLQNCNICQRHIKATIKAYCY